MELKDIILKLASEHWIYADIDAGIIETMGNKKPTIADIESLNDNGYFEVKCYEAHPDLFTFRFTTNQFNQKEKEICI